MEAESTKSLEELLKDELKEEITEICEQLYIAQECLKVVEHLIEAETDRDRQIVKSRNTFFRWSKHMYIRIVIIELNKLFNQSKADDFNILSFIEKLKPVGYFALLNVDENNIAKWESEILSLETSIHKVKLLRHTSFAHKARKKSKVPPSNFTMAEGKALIETAQKVFGDIYYQIFEATFYVGNIFDTPVENLKEIVNTLTTVKKDYLKPLRDHAKEYGIVDE